MEGNITPPQLTCPLAPAYSRQSMIKNFGDAVTVRLKIYSMKKGKYSLALAICMARFVHAFQWDTYKRRMADCVG